MKKSLRLIALLMALVMLFGVTAFAVENDKMTITGIDGTTVTFDTTVDEKINVTYESDSIKEGQFYLVMVVARGEGDTYVPTKDTILYINQTVGQDGVLKFGSETDNAIYPSTIKNSAIVIYGSNIAGEASSLIAAIIDAKYIIGDVDKSGAVDVGDATMLLRYLAGLVADTSTVSLEAADTDGSSAVDVGDATKLLRVLAGLTSFES